MGEIETKLKAMGLALPPPFTYPSPNRTGAVQTGNLLFLSGHGLSLPELPGVRQRGKVGSEVSEREAVLTARAVALTMLATVKKHAGDLDRVKRVVEIFGMVNSAPNFERQPFVIDGASDLLYELFGPERGQHARTAFGVAELPHRMAVEIKGVFELNP